MATLSDVVASRRKSIATIEAEVSEWKSQIEKMPLGDGRKALEGIVRVKEQRLLKLRAELTALLALTPGHDERQVELPQVKRR